MFVNKMARYELLSPDAIEILERGWRRIVSEIGVQFVKPEAVELFRQAGQTVEDQTRLARSGVRARAGREGAARVRRCRRATRRTRCTSVATTWSSRRLRPPFVREGRRPARRHDDRLPQVHDAGPELSRARLGRGRRSASPTTAPRLPAPRHDLRPADAHRQDLHGKRRVGPERRSTRSRWARSCSAAARRSSGRRRRSRSINSTRHSARTTACSTREFEYSRPTSRS